MRLMKLISELLSKQTPIIARHLETLTSLRITALGLTALGITAAEFRLLYITSLIGLKSSKSSSRRASPMVNYWLINRCI